MFAGSKSAYGWCRWNWLRAAENSRALGFPGHTYCEFIFVVLKLEVPASYLLNPLFLKKRVYGIFLSTAICYFELVGGWLL